MLCHLKTKPNFNAALLARANVADEEFITTNAQICLNTSSINAVTVNSCLMPMLMAVIKVFDETMLVYRVGQRYAGPGIKQLSSLSQINVEKFILSLKVSGLKSEIICDVI